VDVGVAADRAEVAARERGNVGGEGVEARRQVEDVVGMEAERGGDPGTVAAVTARGRDGRCQRSALVPGPRRALHGDLRRSAAMAMPPHAARRPASRYVMSRESATAACTSAGPGGRPTPSDGRA